jgi:RNase H-fold protein (predicted Holliday junction resolvase)
VTGAVLGIDPGTRKVGFALIADAQSPPLALGIEPLETLMTRLAPLVAAHSVRAVALGGGTNAASVEALLRALGAPLHLIDETDTTYRARALYFADHPPRGWRRGSFPRGCSCRPVLSTITQPCSSPGATSNGVLRYPCRK